MLLHSTNHEHAHAKNRRVVTRVVGKDINKVMN
jgi:hypothetical protein